MLKTFMIVFIAVVKMQSVRSADKNGAVMKW